MRPTPVDLEGETKGDGAAVGITSIRGPGMVAVDDDEQHPDGEESDQEDTDSGSLDDADADGNLPVREAVQEDLDELLDHVDPELARKLTEENEGKLKSLGNLANMEGCVMFEKQFADLDHCPKCGACRWEGGKDRCGAGNAEGGDDTPNAKASPSAKWGKAKCQFYHWHLKDLLQAIYSHPDVAGLMRLHATREKSEEGILEDIPGE
eukprot:gene10388-12287_t